MALSSSFVVETSEQISEISNEKLMDCIRNYRSIYDKKCKGYKVPQKKKNAWKEVSAQLGIDIDEAQRRYNSIRTNFAKYIKRMRASARSGSGRADLPEIREEFEHLRWLLIHIKHRESTSNIKRKPRPTLDADQQSEEETCNEVGPKDVEDENYNFDGVEESLTDSVNTRSSIDPLDEILSCKETCEDENASNDNDTISLQGEDETGSSRTSSRASSINKKKKTSLQEEIGEERPNKSMRKAWSNDVKAPSSVEMDQQFLKAMNGLHKRLDQQKNEADLRKEEDEAKYFCLSLVGQLKSLEPRLKSMAKLNIMKVFNDIEWSKASFPMMQQPNQYRNLPGSLHNVSPNNQQQLSLNQNRPFIPRPVPRDGNRIENSPYQQLQVPFQTPGKHAAFLEEATPEASTHGSSNHMLYTDLS
eukprot:gene4065-20242_t